VNIVFAGTPAFSVPTLQALLDAGHAVQAVYTQPDRPAGRGRRFTPSPVKQLALARGLPIYQPLTLKESTAELRAFKPDVMVVVAYGLLLPKDILAIPTHGCINVHASLLPRWRGAAPIARAIEAGDTVTGISIMRMEQGLDTGPIFSQAQIPIEQQDTARTLQDKLAKLGAAVLVDTLEKIAQGAIEPRAQDDAEACYARKLSKEETWIDWRQPALRIARKIRAFDPWPVACTRLQGKSIRVWRAEIESEVNAEETLPGTILSVNADGIRVASGAGVLALLRLQAEGGRVMDAVAFVNGHRVHVGDCFTNVA
jgi:methionyl-tRNA formyltransferase